MTATRISARVALRGATAMLAIGALLPQVATAQGAPPPPAGQTATGNIQTEEVVVTGSRLKVSNATSENPVTVVSAAEIARTSAQTVEDVLQRLPAIGSSGLYGNTNNGGQGASCTDIRNLGIYRTLVLVNGRRFVRTGIFGVDCVDLNNIPLSLVDRIEILKDGASATYGADAVGGVVNIILKRNFNGTVVRANGRIADKGDNQTGELGFTTGHNFDRGNIVVSVDYTNRGPVLQRDRDWAVPTVANNSRANPTVFGSGIPTAARIFDDANSTSFLPGSGDLISTGNGAYRDYNRRRDAYDYGQEQFLSGGLEKYSFTAVARYDVNEHITAYAETYYTHKDTLTQLAPQPVTGSVPFNGQYILPDSFVVPAGNPYLTQLFGDLQGPINLYRRLGEFGDRINRNASDTYQFTGGFEGSIGGGWDYTTFFTYGRSDSVIVTNNNVNFQRLLQEVGFRPYDAATAADFPNPTTAGFYDPTVCTSVPGCTLIDPFGPNSISKAGVDYARFNETARSSFTLRTFGGNITNNDIYDLPYGPLGLVLGAEHRRETGSYTPDSLVQTGVTLENAQSPTSGGFDVSEIYGETHIPILAHLPFAEDLHLSIGGRWYDYSTFGSGETWKAAFNYTPVKGIRFRGNIGEAFRQPSINELYGGQALSFNQAIDPCAQVGSYGGRAGAVQARCAAQGIDTATFQQLGNQQVQTITGGNPNLNPETARTETLGVVVEPPFIPGLSATADYWRTKVNNTIGSIGTQDILDGCYTGGNTAFCTLVAPRASQQQLSVVTATNQNLGVLRTDGMDFGLTYARPIGPWGTITWANDLQLLFKFSQQLVPNGRFVGFAGTLTPANSGPGYPRQRWNSSFNWSYGALNLGYRLRYLSGLAFYPISSFNPTKVYSASTPEIFYHDISLSYARRNLDVTFGVDNLFDKDPPFVYDNATNTDPSVYDIYGRVVYLKTSLKF